MGRKFFNDRAANKFKQKSNLSGRPESNRAVKFCIDIRETSRVRYVIELLSKIEKQRPGAKLSRLDMQNLAYYTEF